MGWGGYHLRCHSSLEFKIANIAHESYLCLAYQQQQNYATWLYQNISLEQ